MTGTQRTESARRSSRSPVSLSSPARRRASAMSTAGSPDCPAETSRRSSWPAPTITGARGSSFTPARRTLAAASAWAADLRYRDRGRVDGRSCGNRFGGVLLVGVWRPERHLDVQAALAVGDRRVGARAEVATPRQAAGGPRREPRRRQHAARAAAGEREAARAGFLERRELLGGSVHRHAPAQGGGLRVGDRVGDALGFRGPGAPALPSSAEA